ncbi:MAG: type IV pilus assembly protein PilM [Candidatus Paceibacteria bacterium]|jgi:type IV pilus assembly protein PilM
MNNPLDEFKKMFSKFTSSKEKSVLGIDIGSSAIKLVQMKESGGKAILETYGSISLGLYKEEKGSVGQIASLSTESIVSVLGQLMKEANTTTKRTAVAIPSASTLVFTIVFPASVKESDLKSIVPIESRRYIPIDINEVTLDWWILPKRSFVTPDKPGQKEVSRETVVLVVAVRKDTVSVFKDVVAHSGLTQDFFEVEAFSTVRASIEHDLSTILVLDIGAARTKLVFVDGGVIRDVHVINRGSEDITQGLVASFNLSFDNAESIKKEFGLNVQDELQRKNIEQSIDFIISELKNVVYQYQQKYNVTLEKIILSGGGSRMIGLVPYLNEKLSVDISFSDPFSQTEAPEFLKGALADAGPEFAVAVGLCLRNLRN